MNKRNKKNQKRLQKIKGKVSSTPKKNQEDATNLRRKKAEEFITNLGPDGYFKSSEKLGKNVNIERYSMYTPDGTTPLLQNTHIKLVFKNRYGLVGKNGSGKTTFLKNMASYSIENFPTHLRMVHVEQEHTFDDFTVINAVLNSDIIRTQLIDEEKRLEDLQYTVEASDELDQIDEQLQMIRDHMEKIEIDGSIQRASRILAGLGFSPVMQKLQTKSLSGGQRMRVELAKALFIRPDLLLLDEPTNHLDFPAVLWLQQYLINDFNNTLVVVSHDRTFLNKVMNNTIYLNDVDRKLEYFVGNYNNFEKLKSDEFNTKKNLYRSQQVQITALKEYIEKNKDRGEKRAAQVQSKTKTLDKLLAEEIPEPTQFGDKTFSFTFPEPDHIAQNIVDLEDVSFGYDPKTRIVLSNVGLTVSMDSRVGVIGANGVGKSTLIKLMMSILEPTSGVVMRNRQARIAYFTQHHYDQLNMNLNAVEYFLDKFKVKLEDQADRTQFVRRHLGRFGIKGDRQNQKMGLLSGGQKSRVAFAVLTFETPHFIIMDEPTNHLDIETVDALIDAIKKYPGGVLTISHDQHFLSQIGEEFQSVTPNEIKNFRSFDEAKKFALKKRINEINNQ